ncbi:MAG TPA: hypothetical protein VFQ35_02780 [Polyangiaceae bacterium]|nr:hypothetical protein [Polyangiaceae bacterium]
MTQTSPIPAEPWMKDASLTWYALVLLAMMELGGQRVPVQDIYELLRHHPKAAGTKHWQARIRATLRRNQAAVSSGGRGTWSLCCSPQDQREFLRALPPEAKPTSRSRTVDR